MGFWEANKSYFTRCFDYQGRSLVSEFWWPFLFRTLFYLAVLFVIGGMESTSGNWESDELTPMGNVLLGGMFLFYMINLLPYISCGVRRFHDQDHSGWMFLLRFIPIVGKIVFLVFMCIEGTRGPNRFGDHAHGIGLGDTFS